MKPGSWIQFESYMFTFSSCARMHLCPYNHMIICIYMAYVFQCSKPKQKRNSDIRLTVVTHVAIVLGKYIYIYLY